MCAAGNLTSCNDFSRKQFKAHTVNDVPPGRLASRTQQATDNRTLSPSGIHKGPKITNVVDLSQTRMQQANKSSGHDLKSSSYNVNIISTMQPLDLPVFGPLKAHYKADVDLWRMRNPCVPVTV
jgi:hypothetical protein